MGMFDTITCHYPLKKCPAELLDVPGEWQTKDLDCSLNHYVLTKEGRLLVENSKYEWVEDKSRSLGGISKIVEQSYKDTRFHGVFRMYTNTKSTGRWIEYEIKFTDGQLVKATKIEDPRRW